MKPNQFWHRASDIFTLHHNLFTRAVLTDEELTETVSDFLVDMDGLAGEWYNRTDENKEEPK